VRFFPTDTDQGNTPGEVFEIEDKPMPMVDPETKKPIPMTDAKGKVIFKLDKQGNKIKDAEGNPVMELRMITAFSPEWMEKVPDDTEITFDYPPFQAPVQYRQKKGAPVKRSVTQDQLRKLEEVI